VLSNISRDISEVSKSFKEGVARLGDEGAVKPGKEILKARVEGELETKTVEGTVFLVYSISYGARAAQVLTA
jgi:hypothetical protein